MISKEKSAVFFSKKIPIWWKRSLIRLTRFVEGVFPVIYLGVPLISGRLTIRSLEPLVQKIKKEGGWVEVKAALARWSSNSLRHVLTCMVTHLLVVLDIPKAVHKNMNSILSTFFWGEINGKPKVKWCSWSKLCKPTSEGGLGVCDFGEVQKSLHMKFAWRLMTLDNLWTKFFRAKYVKQGHISMVVPKDSSSRFWKSVMWVLPQVTENVQLKVKNGKGSFWFDNWLASGPLCLQFNNIQNPLLNIKDV
ncbi:uncharacterized mitochondrial protein AtMg00310-like [Malania oleifera]|uniref:uncharacterized mitochondrial protein AtMg00310-like n=1 Tax=Malania oleifera TaxID=397392 RepID=UPI0025AE3E0D|nr:uncharacterized mitochondrial protein AtMg00310-like [Malania oleifera]